MKTKRPVDIMVIRMITNDVDVMPLFIDQHGLKMHAVYIKCLGEVVLL